MIERVNKMRMEKKKLDKGFLTYLSEEKIEKLIFFSFNWGSTKGYEKWEEHFAELEKYKQEHGMCNVPRKSKEIQRWVVLYQRSTPNMQNTKPR